MEKSVVILHQCRVAVAVADVAIVDDGVVFVAVIVVVAVTALLLLLMLLFFSFVSEFWNF